ncbi:MAG: hypothetical protein IJT14_02940 [Rickettsiales bacterium]|nr:hypothetical protein [Rickettsiales bacterium]
MGIVRYHNDEMNKMEMLIYTPSDYSMHLDLERTPYGQWKLTNRDLEQEGRIFQNIDDAFQSIRDRLRSAAWINYNGNSINVNNGQPNHQINVNYPINNYNGPN